MCKTEQKAQRYEWRQPGSKVHVLQHGTYEEGGVWTIRPRIQLRREAETYLPKEYEGEEGSPLRPGDIKQIQLQPLLLALHHVPCHY